MVKGPEKVIRGGHKQGAVLHGIFLVSSQRRMQVRLGDTVKPLDKRFDFGRERPKVERRGKYDAICLLYFWNQVVKCVLLHAGLFIAAGIAAVPLGLSACPMAMVSTNA